MLYSTPAKGHGLRSHVPAFESRQGIFILSDPPLGSVNCKGSDQAAGAGNIRPSTALAV